MTEDTTTDIDEPLSIAVTGAAGYIGSRVIDRLQAAHPDWELTAIDNFYLGDVREIGDVTVRHVDVRDRRRLEDALGGSDIVMHLAAISGVDDAANNPDLTYETNVVGTQNVAWLCRKMEAAMVFPFSMTVLGNPDSFPITVDQPRDPMNWYGRTKVLAEQAVETFAEGAFPTHFLLKSNLYGTHSVGEQVVSKGTVINFFLDRVLAGEPLTVYEPGTQARNYIHVTDVARAYVRSAERLADQLAAGDTGVEKFEIASDEDPSVNTVAETIQEMAREIGGVDVDVELVENPRSGDETVVSEFGVDTLAAHETLGWDVRRSVEETIRERLERQLD